MVAIGTPPSSSPPNSWVSIGSDGTSIEDVITTGGTVRGAGTRRPGRRRCQRDRPKRTVGGQLDAAAIRTVDPP